MIAAVWWWLATPITLARAPIDPNAKLQCVSYAPFRGAQTPLVPTTHIAAEQIAQDLAQLAKITDCVRTYSIENGLDQVPALAAKVGLKVIQGIWLGSNRMKNLAQIAIAIWARFLIRLLESQIPWITFSPTLAASAGTWSSPFSIE